MFWILRKSHLFNVINNNAQSSTKKGYNKLAAEDEANVNVIKEVTSESTAGAEGSESDPTSASETDSSDFDPDEDPDSDSENDSDYDESLTCNVCDRSFFSTRQLERHQQKKRHFGCSACDSLFPSLMALEHHKEQFEHWTDDETISDADDTDADGGDDSDVEATEESERLL